MNIEHEARVVVSRPLAKDLHLLSLDLPAAVLKIARPGQFAHLRVPGDASRLLRRPISLLSREGGLLHLAIQPKGEGTRRIVASAPGDTLNLLFPLGKGFVAGGYQNIWLVGGGVGVAPLQCCAETWKGRVRRAFFGYRTAAHRYSDDAVEKTGAQVEVCSDDGSCGTCGLVSAPLLTALSQEQPELIMACGPTPMLRAIQQIARERSIPVQLSLEERMGCGIGACLTCSCHGADEGYLRVCADGPVFDGEAIKL